MIKNVLQYLEQSARRRPGQLAVTDAEQQLTYGEYLHLAQAVGSALLALHAHNAPVAVYLDKRADSLAAFMGVAYSGNFYVVVDAQMPVDRINLILENLSPAAVLTDRQHLEAARSFRFQGPLLLMEDAIQHPVDGEGLELVRRQAIDTDPLYALFTSGSTGVPKGTVVCHRSVIAYAQWVCETFGIDETTQFGSQTPFYFSMSVLDVFSALCAGATLHILPKKLFSFPVRLLEYMNQRGVNTIYWVPSALCIIANCKALDYVPLPRLKKVLFAGEVMPTKQLNYWISRMPDRTYANLFGPTEITDICTYYVVDRTFADDEPLPIGKPCNNCGVLVLTADGRAAAPGEEGELCVRGSFLAMGYYNNPEKTAQAFTQNPLNPHYPERIYRTGDLVRINERGELLFVTRKDFQIKHMGYRIELGEIETAANALEGMKACACLYDEGTDQLVLVYQGHHLEAAGVLQGMQAKVPRYMVPNRLVRVKQMPYNQNGKIDRSWLKRNYRTLEA